MGTTLLQRTLAFRRKLPLLHHSDLGILRQVLKDLKPVSEVNY